MDDATAVAVIAAYAGLMTFFLLVLLETQRRHAAERQNSIADGFDKDRAAGFPATRAFLRIQILLQRLVVACGFGVTLCVLWFLCLAIGMPAVSLRYNESLTLGPALLSIYVLALVLTFVYLQSVLLADLAKQRKALGP